MWGVGGPCRTAQEGVKDQFYYPVFNSTVISSSWKTCKQDSSCDLVGLKSMGTAKVKMIGHLQMYKSSQHIPLQNKPSTGTLSLHGLFSVIFIKFTFMLLDWQLIGNYWSRMSSFQCYGMDTYLANVPGSWRQNLEDLCFWNMSNISEIRMIILRIFWSRLLFSFDKDISL